MLKKIGLLISFFTFGLATDCSAQDNYINVIGIRGGNPTGVTYKHFITRYSVIEGIAGVNFTYNDPKTLAFALTGLYEYHIYITEGLNLFGGAGLSIGGGKKLFLLNAELIGGVEYTFSNFPINFSLDYKPYYSPIHRDFGVKGVGFNEFGLSIRYVIE